MIDQENPLPSPNMFESAARHARAVPQGLIIFVGLADTSEVITMSGEMARKIKQDIITEVARISTPQSHTYDSQSHQKQIQGMNRMESVFWRVRMTLEANPEIKFSKVRQKVLQEISALESQIEATLKGCNARVLELNKMLRSFPIFLFDKMSGVHSPYYFNTNTGHV